MKQNTLRSSEIFLNIIHPVWVIQEIKMKKVVWKIFTPQFMLFRKVLLVGA